MVQTHASEWAQAWAEERLARVLSEMEQLRQVHNGAYSLNLYSSGGGAFVYERILPLPQYRAAVDFDADSDIDACFEAFKNRVQALSR